MKYLMVFCLCVHIILTGAFVLSFGAVCTDTEFYILVILIILAFLRTGYILYGFILLLPFTGNNAGNDYIPLLTIAGLFCGFRSIPYFFDNFRKIIKNRVNLFFLLFMAAGIIRSLRISGIESIFNRYFITILYFPARILSAQENSLLYPLSFLMLFYISVHIFIYINKMIQEHRIKSFILHFLIFSNLLAVAGLLKYYYHINIPLFFESTYSYMNIPRLSGFFANPGWYGQFLLFLIFPSLYFAISSKKRYMRIVFAFFSLISLISLALTLARAAYFSILMLFLMSIAYLVYRFTKSWKFSMRLSFVTALILILIFSGLYLIKTDIRSHIADNPRLHLYRFALNIFYENPVIGCGIGSFPQNARRHFTEDTPMIVKYYHSTAHNTYLHLLSEGGILMLALFAGLILMHIFRPAQDYFQIAVMISILALIFLALFQYIFYINLIGIWFFIYLSITANYSDNYA